jgi:hypothetical protein
MEGAQIQSAPDPFLRTEPQTKAGCGLPQLLLSTAYLGLLGSAELGSGAEVLFPWVQ